MPTFLFTVLRKDGKETTSTMEAPDRTTVISNIRAQGLQLLALSEQKKSVFSKSGKKVRGKVKSAELVMFTRQLSAMVSAGVPILKSLSAMSEHAESAAFRTIIANVAKDIEGGMSFADALERHPGTFNSVYINMVRAGEAAGILDDILKRLAFQQEKNASIRKKIKSAMTYPMVLIAISICAFFGLMIFVIPMIGKTIKDLAGEDAQLPGLTQAMLAISHFFISFWYIIIPIFIGGVWLVIRYLKTAGKRKFHYFLVHAPIVGQIIRKVAIARFSRTFSALTGAGVAVLDALDITSRAIGNAAYEDSIKNAGKRVKNGEVLSKIINEDAKLYPPIVGQMLSVGEETGQTDKVLVKVADFYEEEVDTAISSLSSIIEPVMIVFMGGMVGLIAASVMMPIAGLANQIKT